jgi:alpha-galactosidase
MNWIFEAYANIYRATIMPRPTSKRPRPRLKRG